MRTNMTDLRMHLFEVIERLKDPQPETPMDIDTAKQIVNVAEVLIDTARVENEYLRQVAALNNGGFSGDAIKTMPGWATEQKRLAE